MIPLDAGASPAYLAKRVAQLAVPRPPYLRPGMSPMGKAAAMAAHLGGKSATMIRGVAVPGVLVDGTAAYPVVGSLVGTTRWLQAERIDQRLLVPGRGLDAFLAELAMLDIPALLAGPAAWELLTCCLLVEPDADVLAVRGRGPGEREDRTSTTSVERGRYPVWHMGPRVLASYLMTGRMPRVLRAYTWRPVGIVAGCRPVSLPGGIVFDPARMRPRSGDTFNDLASAIAEMALRAKTGTLDGINRLAMDRLAGSGKVGRNGIAYGQAVEFNRSDRTHPVWGPFGILPSMTAEEPGWLADPAVGALATAGCELMLTLLELIVAQAGGSIAFADTDAAFVLVTHDGDEIPVDGRGVDGEPIPQCAGTITFERLVEILNRFRGLAEATCLSIPAHDVIPEGEGYRLPVVDPPGILRSVFKVTGENLIDGELWTPGLHCYATAQKRYVLFREEEGKRVSPKSSAFVLGTLANFRRDGELDLGHVEEAWRIGPDLADGGVPAGAVGIDLDEPVFQPMVMSALGDWRALGPLKFATENPEGIRPFETVLVPVSAGKHRARLVAFYEPDRATWRDLALRDPKGLTWITRTADRLIVVLRARGGKVQVVQSLGAWLTDHFSNPEPMTSGGDGRPCEEATRGMLSPRPVRIAELRIAGQETHRRRDEEGVQGWDVQVEQEVFARFCRAPGCRTVLVGRQRKWCEKHREYPGSRRQAWAK